MRQISDEEFRRALHYAFRAGVSPCLIGPAVNSTATAVRLWSEGKLMAHPSHRPDILKAVDKLMKCQEFN